MGVHIQQKDSFRYIDEGKGDTLLLLHGLFGALSNWTEVINYFSKTNRVIIPMLPIYEMPSRSASVDGLVDYVEGFVNLMKLDDMCILGNSLGGHVGLVYTLKNPTKVRSLVLTGSSGLFENSMGASYPKRGDYEFVRKRVGYTFYDPNTATKELIDEVYEITCSIPKCLNIVQIAKSAQRHNMAKDIQGIFVPTLLVWGLNDTITPPVVAHEFERLMPNAQLKFIDKCGHAPMMEHPNIFNNYVSEFLEKLKVKV